LTLKALGPIVAQVPNMAVGFPIPIAFGSPDMAQQLPAELRGFLPDLRVDTLNRQDAVLMHRGYCENLAGVNPFNSGLWQIYSNRPKDWQPIWATPIVGSSRCW